MGTYIAILESEEHWRALSREQAAFRSLLVHTLVLASLLWVGAKCTVPQSRDAGSVLIELQGQQRDIASAQAPGKLGKSVRVASHRNIQSSRRPAVIAKTPNVVSRRAIQVKAVPAKQPAVVASAGGSSVRAGKEPTSITGIAVPPGPITREPFSSTTELAFIPPPSPGTHPSTHGGVMAPREEQSELKSSYASLDEKACKEFFQGEATLPDNADEARKSYLAALACMQEAVPQLKREVGENHPEVAFATMNLGRCYDRCGDFEKAVECFRQSAQLDENLNGKETFSRAATLVLLSDSLKKLQRYEEARQVLLESLPAYETRFGVDSTEVGWTHTRLMDLESLSEISATRKLVFESLASFNLTSDAKIAREAVSHEVVGPSELINLYYVPANRTNPLYLAPTFDGVPKRVDFRNH